MEDKGGFMSEKTENLSDLFTNSECLLLLNKKERLLVKTLLAKTLISKNLSAWIEGKIGKEYLQIARNLIESMGNEEPDQATVDC
jgi:hypothetical protein